MTKSMCQNYQNENIKMKAHSKNIRKLYIKMKNKKANKMTKANNKMKI